MKLTYTTFMHEKKKLVPTRMFYLFSTLLFYYRQTHQMKQQRKDRRKERIKAEKCLKLNSFKFSE